MSRPQAHFGAFRPMGSEPLAHLPRSTILEFAKGRGIYQAGQSRGIYLVLGGTVAVCRRQFESGTETAIELYFVDDLFGESSFLSQAATTEEARALEKTTVMRWSTSEIEDSMLKSGRLAMSFMKFLAQRSVDLMDRLASLAADKVERRLARSLISLADRLGPPAEGVVSLPALSHELLSQYVGTSREVVTHHLTRFRAKGCVQYTRKKMTVDRNCLLGLLERSV